MPYLVLLLAGITFAPLGWPLAWLAAHGYRRVHTRVSVARVRLLVMALLGITPAVLVFIDDYHPVALPGHTLGVLISVAGFPIGWMLAAAVIELPIPSRRARATAL
jgi:hypothetical protein